MRVWRICAGRHAAKAYTGEGARLYGGRWNEPGVAVIYTAGSLALAALELLVHVEPSELPGNLVAIAADVPSDLTRTHVRVTDLPRNWRDYPPPVALQKIGLDWWRAGATAMLDVPSAVIPQERNYLINPTHPDLKRIAVGSPEQFKLDPRLWKTK